MSKTSKGLRGVALALLIVVAAGGVGFVTIVASRNNDASTKMVRLVVVKRAGDKSQLRQKPAASGLNRTVADRAIYDALVSLAEQWQQATAVTKTKGN